MTLNNIENTANTNAAQSHILFRKKTIGFQLISKAVNYRNSKLPGNAPNFRVERLTESPILAASVQR
jgi:hypothetical protein